LAVSFINNKRVKNSFNLGSGNLQIGNKGVFTITEITKLENIANNLSKRSFSLDTELQEYAEDVEELNDKKNWNRNR
jgi:hypothetical protein